MDLERRPLGKTGLQVSVLGLGGSEVGYQDVPQKTVDAIIARALDLGVNMIDTAECYADSEQLIGRALGQRRKDVVLMTKCGHAMLESAAYRAGGFASSEWDPAMLARSIDRSLKRLGTDYLDVIQFHSPPSAVLGDDHAIDVLRKARDAGKARFIGCSTDSDDAIRAVELGVFDTLQISVSIADQEAIERVLPKARERGMGVIAKRPIANAAWLGRSADWYSQPYRERLKKLDYDFLKRPDSATTALRFTLAIPGVSCAIVGTTRPGRYEENARAVASGPLPPTEFEKIRDRWKAIADSSWTGQR